MATRDEPANMATWWQDRTRLRWRNFVYAAAIIIAATCLGYFWILRLWPNKITLLFLAAVLLSGYALGMWPAIAAAFLAWLAYNLVFEEPRFVLTINAEDAFAFTTFLIGALLVGALTGRLSDQARRLKRALTDVTALFDAARDLSVTVDPKCAVERVIRYLEANACHAAIWLIENGSFILSTASAELPREIVDASGRRLADHPVADAYAPDGATLLLSTGGRQVGVAMVWPAHRNELPEPRWTRALLHLAAVAIDRARLIAEITEAHVVAQKEGLRTALLSSLSHDLRTPLSTILASATSLLEYNATFDAATRKDLLGAIQEESERLNRYLGNLLDMTRLESGALLVGGVRIDPREAMSAALRRMERRLVGHPVERRFADPCADVEIDPMLIEQALMNVIENAVAHAPATSAIVAEVRTQGACVVMSIEDSGEGIAEADLPHVFDKFFRGTGDRGRGSGVGLGLAVTRGLVEAFGGSVRAISPVHDGHGTRMEIEFPAHRVESIGT